MDDYRHFFKGVLVGIPVGTILWLVAALLLIAGCVTVPTPPDSLRLGQPPYRVGDFHVFVLDVDEVQKFCARYMPNYGSRFLGCYIAPLKALVTIPPSHDDLAYWVLLHEVKHALEGRFHE